MRKELITTVDLKVARSIQNELRNQCIFKKIIETNEITYVAGADASYTKDNVYAVIVVMTFPDLELVEKVCAVQPISFPYISGLLSFREGPAIVEAFFKLTFSPDLIFLNGQGYAHPRRIGIASHVGVILDVSTIGVANHLLTGTATVLGERQGSKSPIQDKNEIIGMAVRTKEGVKPVYISAGHKVDLPQAVDLVFRTITIHRFPEPLWHADRLSRQCRKDSSV
ncbi:MAG: deoxyribonuclease V [Methanoregulaceae archaeon]|jgi:deoxyribonuclease V